MFEFEDIFYPLKIETKLIKGPRSIVRNYENFLINYFKKFIFPLGSQVDCIVKEDAIHFKNPLGLNCIVPYNDFKQFNESLKFFNQESWENQWGLFFGGILFNQYFQKNWPGYEAIIKKIYHHYKNNNIKDILDIYALKEAKSLIDFLSAKIDFSCLLKSEKFNLNIPSLVNQFIVPTNEIRGNLIRQKQTLNGFIFFLEQHLKYQEKFFYSDIEKRYVPRKEALFMHLILIAIGIIGHYLSELFISYNPTTIKFTGLNIIFSIISLCSIVLSGAAIIGLAVISENIIKVDKILSDVDIKNSKELLNYLDDNPFYFSSLKYNPDSMVNIEIMDMISLLKQFIDYYDETLQLIDQLFDEDDFLPPLNLERFPGHLLKNSFFKLDRNPDRVPKIEKNNNFTIG